jgi:hypothetical protein
MLDTVFHISAHKWANINSLLLWPDPSGERGL